ncbi:MAG TPA: Hsp20/alpha crystallin family protein [Devosiaceae bacterium]
MKKQTRLPSIWDWGRNAASFDDLHKRIDRMFADFSRDMHLPSPGSEDAAFPLMPSMEVHQNKDKVTVSAELPGVEEKDIDITVSDQYLTLSGEKKSEQEIKDGDSLRTERSYGKFSRTITLPFSIEPDKVQARFDKGVLTVTVPKPAEVVEKTKKIPIGK